MFINYFSFPFQKSAELGKNLKFKIARQFKILIIVYRTLTQTFLTYLILKNIVVINNLSSKLCAVIGTEQCTCEWVSGSFFMLLCYWVQVKDVKKDVTMLECCEPEDLKKQRRINQQIEKIIRRDKSVARRELKLLMLGEI